MRTQTLGRSVSVVLTALGATGAIAQAQFFGLGTLDPNGGTAGSWAFGVSPDGTYVVGASLVFDDSVQRTENVAFRWSTAGGMAGIHEQGVGLPGSIAKGVSLDGQTIVGESGFTLSGQPFERRNGRIWTGVGTPDQLEQVFSNMYYATAVTPDGQHVVGEIRGPGLLPVPLDAFRWTNAGGVEDLGVVPESQTQGSNAQAVSADGTVTVGWCFTPDATVAARWVQGVGMVRLSGVPTDNYSEGDGMSPDGTIVVGTVGQDAFRWSVGAGLVNIGRLADTDDAGASQAIAVGTTANGSVIVGYTQFQRLDDGSFFDAAFIWDQAHGMRGLQQALSDDYGISTRGWTLDRATAITPDGSTIVGYGSDGGVTEGWVVRLGAHCGSADFNHDGDTGTDQDLEAFFACLSGNCCAACDSADFNGDGDTGTDQDIEAFFRVLGGGAC
jgi:uncharacterized membrane protein